MIAERRRLVVSEARLASAGSNTLACAVVDLLKSHSDCNIKLEDAMLLLVIAYSLAAQHAHALQGQSAGDRTSPWDPDQERMIKVQVSCMFSHFDTDLCCKGHKYMRCWLHQDIWKCACKAWHLVTSFACDHA